MMKTICRVFLGAGVFGGARRGVLWCILGCAFWGTVWADRVQGGADLVETEAAIVAAHRIDALRREIARHDYLYFRLGEPEISDAAYDRLKAELRALEAAYPDVMVEAPPVAEIGDDRTGIFPTHEHVVPMLSLTKANTEAELRAFDARMSGRLGGGPVDYWVEPKYDGIAVSLTYRSGHFVVATTRGNGMQGDDISANLVAMGLVPQALRRVGVDGVPLPVPDLIEIRGELVMPLEEFARLNAERAEAGERLFANPRNLAAGTVKLRDPAMAAERVLALICFGWGAFEPAEMRPPDMAAWQKLLSDWGLPGVSGAVSATGPEALLEAVGQIGKGRAARPYALDGAVIKLASVEAQERLGSGPTAPRWALAWKFAPERVATRLLGITLQVGRTGVLTPVAELEPVFLDGSTVARASLHNADQIERLDLRAGDFVWVEKAGDIIPQIVGPDLERRAPGTLPFAFPENCPACGHPLERVPERAAIICENRHCPERRARILDHFASRGALDIRGLGPRTVERLLAAQVVSSPADLYGLELPDLLAVPGVGEATGRGLLEAIGASRAASWERVLVGLGLPGVGPQRARALAAVVPDFDALLALDEARLREAPGGGFSEAQAEEILAELAHPETRRLLIGLRAAGVGAASGSTPSSNEGGVFAGAVIVVTGRLERWTRAELTRLLEREGALVRGRVSASTSLLIAGEAAGSNLDRAQALGIEIIDEAEFVRRLAY